MSDPVLNIEHLAKLARIQITGEEKLQLMQQLQSIVGYCSKLSKADVDGLEPLVHSFEYTANVWAEEDTAEEKPFVDYLTQNAPEIKENQIVVPKVL